MCHVCAESIITRAGEVNPGSTKNGVPPGLYGLSQSSGVSNFHGASRRISNHSSDQRMFDQVLKCWGQKKRLLQVDLTPGSLELFEFVGLPSPCDTRISQVLGDPKFQ